MGKRAGWAELLKNVEDRWHTKSGLLLALVVAVGAVIWFLSAIDLSKITWGGRILLVVVVLSVSVVWKVTHIPRIPRRLVGFGVAIQFESSPDAQTLQTDLTLALRQLINSSNLARQFRFLELPQRIARDTQSQEAASHLAERANLTFLLYGNSRIRKIANQESHVLDLKGIVRHAAIDAKRSETFARDFDSALPSRLVMGIDFTLPACEFAARHVDCVARYIIGTAAALSGDLEYSEALLLDSQKKLVGLVDDADAPPFRALAARVLSRLRELYVHWHDLEMERFVATRAPKHLKRCRQLAAKLRPIDSENYSMKLSEAMCLFLMDKNPKAAMTVIQSCKQVNDATWRYSEAFLHAYDGNLDEAYRSYRSAFAAPLGMVSAPTQSEEFIQSVLEGEPQRTWLLFCLGLINHRGKGDVEAARRDYQQFLAKVDQTRFPTQVAAVTKWLGEI